jgi:hypothetical protein
MLLVSSSVSFCPFIFIKTIQIFLYNDLNRNSYTNNVSTEHNCGRRRW